MEFKVDVKYNDHVLGVEIDMAPRIAAQGPSFNDPGSPAEGGEIEIKDMYMHHATKDGAEVSRRLPRSVVERYNHDDMFIEAVREAVDQIGR